MTKYPSTTKDNRLQVSMVVVVVVVVSVETGAEINYSWLGKFLKDISVRILDNLLVDVVTI